ncbi:hypothetical protein J6590_041252 [Homalodisca vitripennis]|nr:hypothetical protein J6590_041252 [Homalodisca vitripennis]
MDITHFGTVAVVDLTSFGTAADLYRLFYKGKDELCICLKQQNGISVFELNSMSRPASRSEVRKLPVRVHAHSSPPPSTPRSRPVSPDMIPAFSYEPGIAATSIVSHITEKPIKRSSAFPQQKKKDVAVNKHGNFMKKNEETIRNPNINRRLNVAAQELKIPLNINKPMKMKTGRSVTLTNLSRDLPKQQRKVQSSRDDERESKGFLKMLSDEFPPYNPSDFMPKVDESVEIYNEKILRTASEDNNKELLQKIRQELVEWMAEKTEVEKPQLSDSISASPECMYTPRQTGEKFFPILSVIGFALIIHSVIGCSRYLLLSDALVRVGFIYGLKGLCSGWQTVGEKLQKYIILRKFKVKTSLGALSVLVEDKILGSRHRHANDNTLCKTADPYQKTNWLLFQACASLPLTWLCLLGLTEFNETITVGIVIVSARTQSLNMKRWLAQLVQNTTEQCCHLEDSGSAKPKPESTIALVVQLCCGGEGLDRNLECCGGIRSSINTGSCREGVRGVG